MASEQEHYKDIPFDEARRLYNEEHMRIRHESMPEGVWIEPYVRPWGQVMMFACEEDGSLSGKEVFWQDLFNTVLTEEIDQGWEAKTLRRAEQ